ncbi:hypothetical protein DVR12_15670 [Chitinophaga silvatica]|uniref:Calcineurin-like phosphoesterase domain-containing protein n=1 Tax=Chitinophaga silvatica TaxID=2282649 RepID=A0A3E1Y8P0_9BACT|nr:metallophosphoesterase family protein [Chitinophaga silvatica]RFS21339.1 hypothetical protein DVR12_15670 [Chitinophaga silvatica]
MILIGDIHGGYPEILYQLKRRDITKANIIQVGDWGLGFNSKARDISILKQIDKFLIQSQNFLYILRGNHDNKWFWDNRESIQLECIKLVQDYEVLTIENRKVLFIGGGISIDRKSRTIGKDYWEDEKVIFDTATIQSIPTQQIDLVISHIAPQEAWPYIIPPIVTHYASNDAQLMQELHQERAIMSQIYAAVNQAGCKEWYYGHYHESNTIIVEGMKFRCLAAMEIIES